MAYSEGANTGSLQDEINEELTMLARSGVNLTGVRFNNLKREAQAQALEEANAVFPSTQESEAKKRISQGLQWFATVFVIAMVLPGSFLAILAVFVSENIAIAEALNDFTHNLFAARLAAFTLVIVLIVGSFFMRILLSQNTKSAKKEAQLVNASLWFGRVAAFLLSFFGRISDVFEPGESVGSFVKRVPNVPIEDWNGMLGALVLTVALLIFMEALALIQFTIFTSANGIIPLGDKAAKEDFLAEKTQEIYLTNLRQARLTAQARQDQKLSETT